MVGVVGSIPIAPTRILNESRVDAVQAAHGRLFVLVRAAGHAHLQGEVPLLARPREDKNLTRTRGAE